MYKLERFLFGLFVLIFPSQLAYHLWPNFSHPFGLPVDYLSPAIYFVDLLVMLILLIRLPRNPTFFRQRFRVVVLLFIAILLFVLNTSRVPLLSLYKVTIFFLYLCFIYSYVLSADYFSKVFFRILPFTVLWLSLLSVSQFYLSGEVGGLLYYLGERPLSLSSSAVAKHTLPYFGTHLRSYATFPHPNALAGFLAVCLMLLFPKHTHSVQKKGFTHFVILLGLLAIFLTGSFGTVVAALLSFCLLTCTHRPKLLFVCMIVLGLIVQVWIQLRPLSLSGRLNQLPIWQNLINKYPVWGTGLGAYVYVSINSFPNIYAVSSQPIHNTYLLLITELGVIPFLVVIVTLCWGIAKLMHNLSVNHLFSWTFILFSGFFDHYWLTSHQNFLLIMILTGLSVVGSKQQETIKTANR